MIWNAIVLAFRQISRNYLRAFLTMLGVIIGVASVIIMITLGNGATQNVKTQMEALGSNLLVVHPARGLNTGGGSLNRKFSMQEVSILRSRLNLKAVAPIASSSPLVQYMGSNMQTTANGITDEYFEVANLEIALGRKFNDDETSANVCIIGQSVRAALFKDKDPIGENIRVGKSICEIVGVLKAKGSSNGNDQDDVVLLPFKTFLRNISGITSIYNINRIMISMHDGADSTQIVRNIKDILRDYRNIKPGQIDTFDVWDTKAFEERLTEATKVLMLFLSAVAGVSLIVGGIGIMNIMLVSVTERTREIGTRLAIGALESDVLLQFLIESIVVSALGGLIGIFMGFFISWFATEQMGLPFIFDMWVALGAFMFSAVVGIVFGYLPAYRASKLDPIEALRYE
ncbi:FtsX-like permease family protein [Helicobacter muridarum]|uniref:ABC transporter permease protein n=1 Tax=Helicobacter muridarum TaxID=216 RepID=A0A377PUE1_9HELI|nr:ABC transporter permease [Helicobacter muridarum]TLD98160.1 FtsX-like permease family protein [Helicobacter muridarum]STQ86486.1 ABC transporter permease protein [Helicobacter muridarum]